MVTIAIELSQFRATHSKSSAADGRARYGANCVIVHGDVSNNQIVHRVPFNRSFQMIPNKRVIVNEEKHMDELADDVVLQNYRSYSMVLKMKLCCDSAFVEFSHVCDELATVDRLAVNSLSTGHLST